jgi:hypothetical protein
MLSAIMTFLGLIPGLSGLITGVLGKVYDAKVTMTTARIGGDVAVATSLVNAAAVAEHARVSGLQVISQSRVLQIILVGFAAPFIFYVNKIVVWDTCLGWGTTPPVRGLVADWGGTIIACLFGSSTLVGMGHMYFNRDKRGE